MPASARLRTADRDAMAPACVVKAEVMTPNTKKTDKPSSIVSFEVGDTRL